MAPGDGRGKATEWRFNDEGHAKLHVLLFLTVCCFSLGTLRIGQCSITTSPAIRQLHCLSEVVIDTKQVILEIWQGKLNALTPEERLRMACSMFGFSRELVAESIRNELPEISALELQKKIFVRFYECDLDPAALNRIIRSFFEYP